MSNSKNPDAIIKEVNGFVAHYQKLNDDILELGLKVKHHEDNIKVLKNQANKLDESIHERQVVLGKYHSSAITEGEPNSSDHQQSEKQTIECVLKQERTAASIICNLKVHQAPLSSKLTFTREFLGLVATLGKVNDDNLSRLFAEFLGLEAMLAIVCKSSESVKALEAYEENNTINKHAGLHGLGPSIGKTIEGRFLVIALENLRTYPGEFIPDDPQRRLSLINPKLHGGASPAGFVGFAVNMIHLDPMHLTCITSDGKGLRETLFYSLFSHLQVYRTRSDLIQAIPCISDGAISLDGGIMKRPGYFSLGVREEIAVRFPLSSGLPKIPLTIVDTEGELKLLRWKRERLSEDLKREEVLLKNAKYLFGKKKNESLKRRDDGLRYATKIEDQTSQNWKNLR